MNKQTKPNGKFSKLVQEFIDSDIAVAEIVDPPSYRINNVAYNITRAIDKMGYRGIIKTAIRSGKAYLINYTLIEEV